jgi:putative ABC transport system permease protein
VSFLTLVFKNLLRRPTRSLLTLTGIAVGIAAVVALSSIAWGFQRSWVQAYTARGTDMIVTKVTSRDPLPTPFGEAIEEQLRHLPHIQEVSGVLSDMVSIEDAPTVLVFGWERQSFLWGHLKLVSGRWPTDDHERTVVIGTAAAEVMKKSVGDTLHIENEDFRICGTFSSAAFVENGTIILALRQMQHVMDNEGKVNILNLKLTSGTTDREAEELRQTIKSRLPGYNAFTGGEVAQSNMAIQAAKAMSWATSFVALVVGAVGVANTMLMSVFERIHEIGILLAIGWKRRRIVLMIIYESMALSFVGGIGGIALGYVAVNLLQATPWIRGKFESEVDLPLCALALAIALGLGALGGLYPAYRGSRLHPSEALRYE